MNNMKKFILVGLLAVLCILSLTGCGTGSEDLIIIIDEAGRLVTCPHPPERIVCLVPSVVEVIYALDESDRIVGITDDCDMPPVLHQELDDNDGIVGRVSNNVNVELILDLNPDLVIGRTGGLFPEVIEDQIKMNDVPVLRYRGLHINTLLPMIEDIGLILDKEDEAEELSDYIENYHDQITERVEPLSEGDKPQVYFMSMGHVDWTGGAESATQARITDAGGINIAADRPGSLTRVSREWILEENPDVILYSRVGTGSGVAPTAGEMEKTLNSTILSEPGFSDLDAVKNGNLHLFDISLMSGPRVIVGLLYYAKWFHPDLFDNVDPKEVHEEMLQKYYDMELEGTWAYPE